MMCLVLSMTVVSTWRDILSGSSVVLANVYTQGTDNAVDAIERRTWQFQMIQCIVYNITLAILEHALSLRTWLIFTASFCSMSLCDNVNINIRGCLGSSTSAGMMSHTSSHCHLCAISAHFVLFLKSHQ